MERTYKALIEASHSQAVKSGWWEGGIEARSLDDQFNNFHAEVSESWEEYRAGRMETWYAPQPDYGSERPPKPEGFWVEIADLLIRLADTCGAYMREVDDFGVSVSDCNPDSLTVPEFINSLHESIVEFRDDWESPDIYAGCMFDESFAFARAHNIDLWAVIEEKMAYNATRPWKHGNKKA